MTDRPLRKDAAENRERLLQAAAKIFTDEGLGATVDDIAREAGVGMGTLYRRFPTKEALIEELVRQQLLDVLEAAHVAAGLPDGLGLEAFLWETGELQASRTGCLARLWTEAGATALIEDIRHVIARLLADGQRHDRIRPDVGVPDISLLLWGLNGVISTTQAVAPTAWRRALELSIAGLRPSTATLVNEPLTRSQLEEITSSTRTHGGVARTQ